MNSMSACLIFALGLALPVAALAEQENYHIDDNHSFANFTIRHVASKMSGTFPDVKGDIVIDRAHLENSSVDAHINLLSVNSSHAKRDEHIKKEEYLDANRFGDMHFVSSKVVATGTDGGMLTGNLTLHGITREMTFPFKVLGFGNDPWGGYRVGLEAHTALKASDFDFGWGTKPNAPVGDDIDITLLIEGVRYSPEHKSLQP